MNTEIQHIKTYGIEQKSVLKGKLIIIQASIKKQLQKYQINNLTLHLKELGRK